MSVGGIVGNDVLALSFLFICFFCYATAHTDAKASDKLVSSLNALSETERASFTDIGHEHQKTVARRSSSFNLQISSAPSSHSFPNTSTILSSQPGSEVPLLPILDLSFTQDGSVDGLQLVGSPELGLLQYSQPTGFNTMGQSSTSPPGPLNMWSSPSSRQIRQKGTPYAMGSPTRKGLHESASASSSPARRRRSTSGFCSGSASSSGLNSAFDISSPLSKPYVTFSVTVSIVLYVTLICLYGSIYLDACVFQDLYICILIQL